MIQSGSDARVAIVTGGGRGIGRQVARSLGSAGWSVAVVARSVGQIDEAATEIEDAGGRALAVQCDVSSADQVSEAVRLTERDLGPVAALVNAAGIWSTPARLWESDVADWWRVVEVDLKGPMMFIRAVLPGMVDRGTGCIVNLNSMAGTDARSAKHGSSAYAVAKAGLFRLTHVLAAELDQARSGVHVFDLTPGLVRTQLTDVEAFSGVPDEQWTDVDRSAAAVLAMVDGRLDALSGRCIDAVDDIEELIERARRIVDNDGRVLELRHYGDDDPLRDAYPGTQ